MSSRSDLVDQLLASEPIPPMDQDARILQQNDRRRDMPRFQGANAQWNLKLLAVLKELSGYEKCSPAQLAIAWLLSRKLSRSSGSDIQVTPALCAANVAARSRVEGDYSWSSEPS